MRPAVAYVAQFLVSRVPPAPLLMGPSDPFEFRAEEPCSPASSWARASIAQLWVQVLDNSCIRFGVAGGDPASLPCRHDKITA